MAVRAARAMALMKEISMDKHMDHALPLPVEPQVIARLIIPQLDQIRQFAEFRAGMKNLEKMYGEGASKEALSAELERLWQPVPDYNGVIGVWGQIEQRTQTYYVRLFCKKAGIPIPKRPWRRFMWMKRFYETLGVAQRGCPGPVYFNRDFYEGGYPFLDEYEEIMEDLVNLGVFIKNEEGKVCLADWDNYKYDFCIW